MNKVPIKRQSIIPRMDGIMRDIDKLRTLAHLPEAQFCAIDTDSFDLAKLRLREALEGVLNIGAHLISRVEGGRPTEYKDIARKLGELGFVERAFAEHALIPMAGYRNRLTHFYAEITPAEMYQIIHTRLDDFTTFLSAIKLVLEHPERFNLTVE